MNVDALQTHLTNLSRLLRSGGGKGTASELDEFVELLQPYRGKKLKDLIGAIKDAEEIVRNGPPPAQKQRKSVAKVDAGPISSRILDLYQRAGQSSATSDEIIAAFSEPDVLSLTGDQLKAIAKQMGIKEKLKKPDLLNKMRQAVLDRRGVSDRVSA